MKPRRASRRVLVQVSLSIMLLLVSAKRGATQTGADERAFPQSKTAVEKALKELQASMSGRLPVVEGFAVAGEHPLSRYRRGYYQSIVQVKAAASGGSVVRVSAKVTAWYADPVTSRSGYELLSSNGRLEADLLDRLADQLASNPGGGAAPNSLETSKPEAMTKKALPDAPSISMPMPTNTGGTLSSSPAQSLHGREPVASATEKPSGPDPGSLQAEAASLEEVLKNQAHPKNLVAVRKSGTPVVATASLRAKTLLLASAHDEFELLDYDPDWVHVRVSGLQRGWIWRDGVEMPEDMPDISPPAVLSAVPAAVDLFEVTREETAPFPGDWEPLRGKSVEIISVQKARGAARDTGPRDKLEFAKFLLEKNYPDVAKKSPGLSGIVLIFDAADGGMIAAPLAALEQWKAGTLSDPALWHRCFFDPPETFIFSSSFASR